MIHSYVENPKDYIHRPTDLLELINKLSKVAGYKFKTQKSIVFLYTAMNNPKRKIGKQLNLQ